MSVFPTNDEFCEGKDLFVLFITVTPALGRHPIKICRMDGLMAMNE